MFDDEEDEGPSFEDMSPEQKEEFYEFVGQKMHIVMNKAENHGVLFDLITSWPREKQLAFAVSTVIESQILDDDKDN